MITSSEIKSLTPDGLKHIFDHQFTVPTHEEVSKAVKKYISERDEAKRKSEVVTVDELSSGKNNEEKDDCDNRAFKMFTALMGKGWDFAFVSIPGHAVCGYIDSERKWRYFEPLDGAEIDSKIKHVVTIMA